MTVDGVTSGQTVSVSTNTVSAREGFEWWNWMVGEAVGPMSITGGHTDRFRGETTVIRLPQTEISFFSFSPLAARRAPAHIRAADPECYFLLLVHGSPIGLEQRRNNTCLKSGDMALFDTSHPLACEFEDHGRLTRVSLIRLPRDCLPLPADQADGLLGTSLSSRTGPGALLSGYLTGLRENAGRWAAGELTRLETVGFDLAATFLAGHIGHIPALQAETRQQALRIRIEAFIDYNLARADLTPVDIAAHHHISVRLLHQLFRHQPETIAATIRRRRLDRSRADLADPRLAHMRIGEIAARWGFRHQADFSRAFRLAYGMSPTDFRHTAATGALEGTTA